MQIPASFPSAPRLPAPAILSWMPRSFAFGPFLLQPERQLLLEGETPLRIGGRALDLLTVLVEQPGQLIGKAALLERVWPGIFVAQGNLKANMASLRRVLGERPDAPRYIATVVGRGYRFIAPVEAFGP
jgi:DNA-binding winged helix-turn-helix (wHTH) protein